MSASELTRLQALAQRSTMGTYVRAPVVFERGKGCRLWDAEGVEYLDGLSGIGVCNVGHAHPAVVAAVCAQAGRLLHVSNLFWTAPAAELADRLARRSLGGKVFLCNSGAEANEAAIKLARRARPGGEIVVFRRGFHGRTLGALSATPQEAKQAPFAPLIPGFVVCDPDRPEEVSAAVGPQTAAVLVEPVQGEGGVHPVGVETLVAARDACDREGAALIFDEVQSGMGRCGTLWAYQGVDVVPDAMTAAKGLGGGLPIGALVTGQRLADALRPGDHGTTFGGGPVVCSAALAVLDVMEADGFLAGVRERGERLGEGLASLPGVGEVRGRGLMWAFDLPGGGAPELVARLLLKQRLVVNATGPETVRIMPPLVVSEGQIDDLLDRLRAGLTGAGGRG